MSVLIAPVGIETVMLPAIISANYILSLTNPDIGDVISNLKLQKLLYYSQGFALAITGKPLFGAAIHKGIHGPFVPAIFKKFDVFHYAIKLPDEFIIHGLSDEQKEVLNEVYEVYGQFSGWKLAGLVANDPLLKSIPIRGIVSKDKMKKHFLTLIEQL